MGRRPGLGHYRKTARHAFRRHRAAGDAADEGDAPDAAGDQMLGRKPSAA